MGISFHVFVHLIGEPKRRSFSSAFSSMFRRTPPQTIRESQFESSRPGSGDSG